jgi:type V secretory pathway adhesin AidA
VVVVGEKISFSNLRAEFTTYNTGGSLITPKKIKIQKHQAIQTNLI